MRIFAETDRLLLRELLPTDDSSMFELDSDPDVHFFLGNHPVKTIEESRAMIALIRQQYVDYSIGRWAVIQKQSGDFMGWAGLKYITGTINGHSNFYDIGYRFIKRYWGNGYATEAGRPAITYGFTQLNLQEMYGMANATNHASKKTLQKLGLKYIEDFDHNGTLYSWFKITRS